MSGSRRSCSTTSSRAVASRASVASGQSPDVQCGHDLVDALRSMSIALPAVPVAGTNAFELVKEVGWLLRASLAQPADEAIVLFTVHAEAPLSTQAQQVEGEPKAEFGVGADMVDGLKPSKRIAQFVGGSLMTGQ